jgi:archaeoflavoprotein AfpA
MLLGKALLEFICLTDSMKVAWGITGSGDLLPETISVMKEIANIDSQTKLYVFLSKAARQVVRWYGLSRELDSLSSKIFQEVDANTTEPFYYLPGALQLGKFNFFLVCPATANTVAKIVNGIADTLITNSVAQATKANVPTYILPVDQTEGNITTKLPSGQEMELEMRQIDLDNLRRLSSMKSIHVLHKPSEIKAIIASTAHQFS